MQEIGKYLVIAGVVISILGVFLWLGFGKWMGRLPGDIAIVKENFSFYFPVVTCIVLSAALTLLFWIFRR